MHRPRVAVHPVLRALARLDVHAGDPEHPAARRLEVVPDRAPVPAPELVAGDLHVHRPLVLELHRRAVGADGPDAIDLVPRALVAVEQQARILRVELHVVEPAV